MYRAKSVSSQFTNCFLDSAPLRRAAPVVREDRKSTRLNSSHLGTSYAVFCLKKTIRVPAVVGEAERAVVAVQVRQGVAADQVVGEVAEVGVGPLGDGERVEPVPARVIDLVLA